MLRNTIGSSPTLTLAVCGTDPNRAQHMATFAIGCLLRDGTGSLVGVKSWRSKE